MGVWWTYLIFEAAQNGELFTPVPYWDHGILGKVTWDIDWFATYKDISLKP